MKAIAQAAADQKAQAAAQAAADKKALNNAAAAQAAAQAAADQKALNNAAEAQAAANTQAMLAAAPAAPTINSKNAAIQARFAALKAKQQSFGGRRTRSLRKNRRTHSKGKHTKRKQTNRTKRKHHKNK
jgi:hypothetical protein